MKAIVNAKIVLPERCLENTCILFDGRIAAIGERLPEGMDCEIIDGTGCTVTPGLIDLHIHGMLGCDFTDGDPDADLRIARKLPEYGVTGFLPTVMTAPRDKIIKAFDALRPLIGKTDSGGSIILGIHSEGPFINPKRKGAQDPNGILPFDADLALAYKDSIRLMAMAPEMDGAEAFIRRISKESEIVLSIGHSDGNFNKARMGFALGIRHVTHLFNAMSPLSHREPGVAGAALASPEISCELIADGFHVHPALFELIARAKGDKLCLITDCVRPGGLPDGQYTDGAGSTVYKKGCECRLPDGTIAGSVLTMDEGLRNLLRHTSLPLHRAVYAATAAPAAVLKLDHKIGKLKVGYDSDLVLWDKDMKIKKTIIKGEIIHE